MHTPKTTWPPSEEQLHHALIHTLGLERNEHERQQNIQKAWQKFEARVKAKEKQK